MTPSALHGTQLPDLLVATLEPVKPAGLQVVWMQCSALQPWAQWLAVTLGDADPALPVWCNALQDAPEQAQAHLLALVMSPADVLAQTRGNVSDLQRLRALWLEQARDLLQRRQAAPERVALLPWRDLVADPQAAALDIAAAMGCMAPASGAPAPAPTGVPGPELALAEAWVGRDTALQLAWSELVASSAAIESAPSPMAGDGGSLAVAEALVDLGRRAQEQEALHAAHRAAEDEVRRLHAAAQQQQQTLDTLRAAHDLLLLQWEQAREELAGRSADCAALQTRLGTVTAERDAAMARAQQQALLASETTRAAANEVEHLRRSLSIQHEEHERQFATWQATVEDLRREQARLTAQAVDERVVAETERDRAWQQAKTAETERDLALERALAAESERDKRLAAPPPAPPSAALEEERDFLLDALQAALAALEGNTRLPAATEPDRATAPALGKARIVGVRDAAPHRELSFEFDGVETPAGAMPKLLVRLVDHNGQPGLVLFAAADGRAPLTQWQPGGSEDGREFMILLPRSNGPKTPLFHMASADWRFVAALADTLLGELPRDLPGLHVRWRDIAARLQQQFRLVPPRLRYGGMQLERARADHWSVQLDDVVYGNSALGTVRLDWTLAGANGPTRTLAWQRDPTQPQAPLAGWPVDEDGTLAATWKLPLGTSVDASMQAGWWSSLCEDDVNRMLAVLDALPATAAVPGGEPGLGIAARALHRSACRTLNQLRTKGRLRGLLRRALRRH